MHQIPKSQKQAYEGPDSDQWKAAEIKHLSTLLDQNTFELVDLPPGHRAIPTKWVYTRKGGDKEGRSKLEYSARLVLLGFLQREGIDYKETFAPTVQWRVLRYFIALWTDLDWDIGEKIDLKQAFNATPTDIAFYTSQPPGHRSLTNPEQVLKVNGSLPGAKQSSRNLHLALRRVAQAVGFSPINSEVCLYRWFQDSANFLFLIVWVDDLFFFGQGIDSNAKIAHFVEALTSNKYAVHRLGDISQTDVLGVRVQRNRQSRTTTLDLEEYIAAFLKATHTEGGTLYWDCKETRDTPSDPKMSVPKTSKDARAAISSSFVSPKNIGAKFNYLSRVMTLMYPSLICRPDISFAVTAAARSSSDPSLESIDWLHHLCLYLNGTRTLKLIYTGGNTYPKIQVFTDASWIDDLVNRHTSMGRAVFLANSLIDWKCQKITRIMTSTNHAEFYASNEAVKDAVFFNILGTELGLPALADCVMIHGDNENALLLSKGRVTASKCRHYDLLLFYQREQFELQKVDFHFVPTQDNLADIFTKSQFSKSLFTSLRSQLMGTSTVNAFMGACRNSS